MQFIVNTIKHVAPKNRERQHSTRTRNVLVWVLLLATGMNNMQAQYATSVTVTDIDNVSVLQKIQKNASDLLSEFNTAFFAGKTPALNKISGLSKDGRSSLLSMWSFAPFRCIESQLKQSGISTPTGYQIRNIPMFLKDMPEEEAYQEIVINFDRAGNIYDIYFALESHQYMQILASENNDVSDLRCRQIILDFVENFRTAYNRKDIAFLEKVYSDDALIITGKVIKTSPSAKTTDMMSKNRIPQEKIEYQVKTKAQYLTSLSSVFRNNARINIIFEDIEVTQHPKYDDIYGITLKQGWNTTNYSDVGYVFLMIDFKDMDNPMIHVRTWQPEKLNGKDLSHDEIFSLGEFEVI